MEGHFVFIYFGPGGGGGFRYIVFLSKLPHRQSVCVPGRFKACPLGPAKLSLGQVGSEGVG